MFKGCEKIYTPILKATKNYPKDISYRGQGLSNEYRLRHASGLTRAYQERLGKKLLVTSEEGVQVINTG